jgi:hypothetical protein
VSHLVVPGVDPADQRTSWDVLHARRGAYYRERERAFLAAMCAECRHQVHGQCVRRAWCSCRDAGHPPAPATTLAGRSDGL